MLATPTIVSLEVYDLQGRRVAEVLPRTLRPVGPHDVTLSVACLPPGCYLYRLDGGRSSATRKMIVVK